MKLTLGTVQFGLDYGVSNTKGKTDQQEVARILHLAQKAGIDTLDTAHHYGESEAVIGNLSEISQPFKIITKTAIFNAQPITSQDTQRLTSAFEKSLALLKRESVYGLLIHHVDNVFSIGGEKLYSSLNELKETGRVKKIGASLYSPEQANQLLSNFDVDIVQVPLNLMDQRMLAAGLLDRFQSLGIEVHIRSAFLQGLFFMTQQNLPTQLRSSWPYIKKIGDLAQQMNVSVSALALGFLKQLPSVQKIVIGVNSKEQLKANLDAFAVNNVNQTNFETFACDEINLIDPSKWSAQK